MKQAFFLQIWPRRRAGRGNLVRDGYQDQALLRPSIAKGGGGGVLHLTRFFAFPCSLWEHKGRLRRLLLETRCAKRRSPGACPRGALWRARVLIRWPAQGWPYSAQLGPGKFPLPFFPCCSSLALTWSFPPLRFCRDLVLCRIAALTFG